MKKSIFVLALIATIPLSGCEQYQKVARNKLTLMGGNFKVTYAAGTHVKTWIIRGGKVTSEPKKGYYFFWATVGGKEKYVQVPIERTYIEEM